MNLIDFSEKPSLLSFFLIPYKRIEAFFSCLEGVADCCEPIEVNLELQEDVQEFLLAYLIILDTMVELLILVPLGLLCSPRRLESSEESFQSN
jgi:hypothetical protein